MLTYRTAAPDHLKELSVLLAISNISFVTISSDCWNTTLSRFLTNQDGTKNLIDNAFMPKAAGMISSGEIAVR